MVDSSLRPPGAPSIVAAALVEQADKYRLLVELAAGEPGRTPARRDAMRAIAARFPGALREWEALSPAELKRRGEIAGGLARRAGGEEVEAQLGDPALAWLRLAIQVQERLRAALAEVRADAASPASARSPGSRLSARVHEEIARREGISVGALKAALFPRDHHDERGVAT